MQTAAAKDRRKQVTFNPTKLDNVGRLSAISMIYKPHCRVLYMDNTFYIASSVLFYSSPIVHGNSHLVTAIHSVCYQDVFGAGLG